MPTTAHPMQSDTTTALYCAVQFGKTLLWVAADLVAFYVLSVVERMPVGDMTVLLERFPANVESIEDSDGRADLLHGAGWLAG